MTTTNQDIIDCILHHDVYVPVETLHEYYRESTTYSRNGTVEHTHQKGIMVDTDA